MKLRRAMALAAATAVIAPAALLAAPAAYAEDAPTTQTTTDGSTTEGSTTAGTEGTTGNTTEGTEGATGGDTGTEGATEGTTGGDTEGTTGGDTEGTTGGDTDGTTGGATEGTTGGTTEGTTEGATGGTTEGTTEGATGGDTDPGDEDEKPGDKEPGDEDEEPGDGDEDPNEFVPCEVELDEDGDFIDPASALELDISGLPGKIVAGSGWHNFTMTASNPTDEALGEVHWIAFVDNYADSDDENDWLSTHAKVEYLDPASKTWTSIDALEFMGQTSLGAKDVVDLQLRVNIDAKAPAGDSFAFGFGAYLDADEECYRQSIAFWEFTVLAPGSENPKPGKPKPLDPVEKPAPSPKEPQGGAEEIPVTGSLAETGSSSAMPMFALAGGAAVALGIGAMYVVRRRNAGSES